MPCEAMQPQRELYLRHPDSVACVLWRCWLRRLTPLVLLRVTRWVKRLFFFFLSPVDALAVCSNNHTLALSGPELNCALLQVNTLTRSYGVAFLPFLCFSVSVLFLSLSSFYKANRTWVMKCWGDPPSDVLAFTLTARKSLVNSFSFSDAICQQVNLLCF